MKPILEVNHVAKKYSITHVNSGYLSLRDKLQNALLLKKDKQEDFWALKDVSFDVQNGESIGIIGKNGAGKSTLLKILSKITPPTKGRIVMRGRVASLLEVGTGFHLELTGRENIFFNGSLLGMRRAEIYAKFDEIVDFSGVEKFLDTPLKHYSSGMQLRLAFAVAAFLDPEILIMDEVLAVGDAEFQKKCLGKMEDVGRSGRTILFVSHNMNMIKQLCSRTVWIDKGHIKLNDRTESVVNEYLVGDSSALNNSKEYELANGVKITNIEISANPIMSLTDAVLSFVIQSNRAIKIDSLGFYWNNTRKERVGIIDLRKGIYKLGSDEKLMMTVRLKRIPLIEGEYSLGLFIGSDQINGNFDDLLNLQVSSVNRRREVVDYPVELRGKLEFDFEFDVKQV